MSMGHSNLRPIIDVFSRDDEEVRLSSGIDVLENHAQVVLIDDFGLDLACYDTSEYVRKEQLPYCVLNHGERVQPSDRHVLGQSPAVRCWFETIRVVLNASEGGDSEGRGRQGPVRGATAIFRHVRLADALRPPAVEQHEASQSSEILSLITYS